MTDLIDIDQLSIEEILKLQSKELQRSVEFAMSFENYRRVMPQVEKLRGKSLTELTECEVLSPTRLGDFSPPQGTEMVCESAYSGPVLASGGSSGKRKVIFHTWPMFRNVMKMGARGLRRRLGRKPKRIANCFLPGSLWGGFVFGNGVAEELDSQLYALGRPSLEELTDVIDTYKIDCFFSSPSFAYSVFLSPKLKSGSLSSLTDFCYVGESPSESQLLEIAKRFPDLKVHSLAYTANETGTIGYQCPQQNGGLHHIHEDFAIVEIVDPQTLKPVKEGESGEILVTTLATKGVPLFRYQIGDVGRNLGRQCPCGSKTLVIDLLGRSSFSTNICGTILSADYTLSMLKPEWPLGVHDVQVLTSRKAGKTFVQLLISEAKVSRDQTRLIIAKLSADIMFKEIIEEAQCGGFTVEVVDPAQFLLSKTTGKKPFFYDCD